jgi:hypothetical protein
MDHSPKGSDNGVIPKSQSFKKAPLRIIYLFSSGFSRLFGYFSPVKSRFLLDILPVFDIYLIYNLGTSLWKPGFFAELRFSLEN